MHSMAFKPAPSANTLEGGDAARIIPRESAFAIVLGDGRFGILEIVSDALRKANAFACVGCPSCRDGRAAAFSAHEKAPLVGAGLG